MNPFGLVRLDRACPGIAVDLRYAGSSHFFGKPLYHGAEAWLLEGAARRLQACRDILARAGLGLDLLVLDAFRPLSAQALMWESLPDENFVAPPSRGSVHNRGAAVDVTLIDASRRELPMPTPFDEFSPRASHEYAEGPPETLANRETLRAAMEAAGFRAYAAEWWHYTDPELRTCPLVEATFAELAAWG